MTLKFTVVKPQVKVSLSPISLRSLDREGSLCFGGYTLNSSSILLILTKTRVRAQRLSPIKVFLSGHPLVQGQLLRFILIPKGRALSLLKLIRWRRSLFRKMLPSIGPVLLLNCKTRVRLRVIIRRWLWPKPVCRFIVVVSPLPVTVIPVSAGRKPLINFPFKYSEW